MMICALLRKQLRELAQRRGVLVSKAAQAEPDSVAASRPTR